jgi:hypothetical protein
MKPDNKVRAEALRREGWMYSSISKELSVPKSTVHYWLKNIALNLTEASRIEKTLLQSKLAQMPNLAKAKKKSLAINQEIINIKADDILSRYDNKRENNIVLLSMLFWGEGEKDLSGGVRFINSDPLIVELYLKLLRDCFDLDENKLKVQLHVHSYHNVDSEIHFWSKITCIPKSHFYKPYQKANTGKRKRENYHGTVSIRYADSELGKLLKMVYTRFGKRIGV